MVAVLAAGRECRLARLGATSDAVKGGKRLVFDAVCRVARGVWHGRFWFDWWFWQFWCGGFRWCAVDGRNSGNSSGGSKDGVNGGFSNSIFFFKLSKQFSEIKEEGEGIEANL